MCRGVWPRRGGKREGRRWVVVGVTAHNREKPLRWHAKGVSGGVRYGLWGFDISNCVLKRTHEEALCIPGRNVPFQACFNLIGIFLRMYACITALSHCYLL
jgi:hypothetical protein